jgi:hypothetical protein
MNVEAFWELQSEGSQRERGWAYLDPNRRRMLKTAFFSQDELLQHTGMQVLKRYENKYLSEELG